MIVDIRVVFVLPLMPIVSKKPKSLSLVIFHLAVEKEISNLVEIFSAKRFRDIFLLSIRL